MTLREQIKQLADQRFGPTFATQVNMGALISALCEEIVRKEVLPSALGYRAVKKALELCDMGNLTEDVPAVT